MREKKTPIRAEPDDPRRCQATTVNGQCPFLALDDHSHCSYHTKDFSQERKLYDYNKTEFLKRLGQRVDAMTSSNKTRDLSEEIGITRITLENILGRCNEDFELQMATPQILDLVQAIQKLIESSVKVDKYIGQLMSKQQVVQIGQELVNCIAEEIGDEDKLRRIAKNFESIIQNSVARDDQ